MISEPGIFDLDEATYHQDPAPEPSLSSTLARTIISRSPAHAWWACPRLNPDFERVEKEAFDIGRAAHAMLLGKGAPIEVVDAENWTTKAAREARAAAREAGHTPMLLSQFEAAQNMARIARDRLLAFGIDLAPERPERNELCAFARIDDVWCRAMIDHAPADPAAPLIDVKTCEDASPDACVRAVAGYSYDVQMAHYLDVWRAATGESRGFRFVFIEKAPPHEVGVVELYAGDDEADWMTSAYDKAREARRLWGYCLRTGQWPGFPAQVCIIGAPTYHVQKWELRAKPTAEALARAAEWQAPTRAAE